MLFRDASGKAAALADRCCHRAAPPHLGTIVDIASDATRMRMRSMVERLIAAERGALAAE